MTQSLTDISLKGFDPKSLEVYSITMTVNLSIKAPSEFTAKFAAAAFMAKAAVDCSNEYVDPLKFGIASCTKDEKK